MKRQHVRSKHKCGGDFRAAGISCRPSVCQKADDIQAIGFSQRG
jgi:hypothetical protein